MEPTTGISMEARTVPSLEYQAGITMGIAMVVHMENSMENSMGISVGIAPGISTGIVQGNQMRAPRAEPASLTGNELANALGVDLHVVEGIVHACSPGERLPPTAAEHAADFLRWLQAQPLISGNEVPSRLLEERLFPYYASISNAPRRGDRSRGTSLLSRVFSDVRLDDRVGPDRVGSSTTVYLIPSA